jgi:hypothetical protein
VVVALLHLAQVEEVDSHQPARCRTNKPKPFITNTTQFSALPAPGFARIHTKQNPIFLSLCIKEIQNNYYINNDLKLSRSY